MAPIPAYTPGESSQLSAIRYRLSQLPAWQQGEAASISQRRYRLTQAAASFGGSTMPVAQPPAPTFMASNSIIGDLGRGLLDAAGGFLRGGPVGAVTGVIGGVLGGGSEGPGGSPVVPGMSGFQASPCQPGYIKVGSRCVKPTAALPGGQPFTMDAYGSAVLGQFGTALQPGSQSAVRLLCPPGSVLGKDNLCYNKSQLRKSERKWVPPRKPLLTGGELNAIRTAASAARKLRAQESRLQSMGMLPKHVSSRRRK